MMEPLVYAAASNDLDSIHRLLEQERARNPQLSQTTSFPRFGMHDACIAAAKHNQIGALSILLDNGAFITQGELVQSIAIIARRRLNGDQML
jgi:hypothetical protein